MKKQISFIITILCVILFVGAGWFVCENQLVKKESDFETKVYEMQEIQLVNLEQMENKWIAGVDPQLILTQINGYVNKICLTACTLNEEVQLFYTENLEEVFSEEKSIWLTPKTTKTGSVVVLDKNVVNLRIDFTGTEGSTYTVTEVVLNPQEYLEWGVGVGVFAVLAGVVCGIGLSFLLTEGKYFRVYFQALKKYRFLLEDMVVRDIKLKYRRSVIGLLWSVLNPLLMMVVITAVFQNLFRFEIENFAVYYLTGWVVFNFITEATSGAMTSIIGASALIRKVYIPKYIFPMQKCIFSFVNMLFSLVALVVVMLVLGVEFTWNMLLIPIPLALALVFAIGLGMILSTVAVFFRDMIHLYGIFTLVWMYLTPIIYPEEILVGVMKIIMKWNPMYYYVDYFRQLTLYGTLPDVKSFVIMCVCSAVSLLLGVVVFKKKQDRFILFI